MGAVGIAEVWDGNAEDPDHRGNPVCAIAGPAVRDLMGGFSRTGRRQRPRCCPHHNFPDIGAFDDGIPGSGGLYRVSWLGVGTPEMLWAAVLGSKERVWTTTAFSARDALSSTCCVMPHAGMDVRILKGGPHQDQCHLVKEDGLFLDHWLCAMCDRKCRLPHIRGDHE
jgi:hypothetical protein